MKLKSCRSSRLFGITLFSTLSFLLLFPLTTKAEVPAFRVEKRLDLRGDTLRLSPGSALWFGKNGRIENGTVIGDDSTIEGKREQVFSGVTILGSWLVPEISSAMFVDAETVNGLVPAFSLMSDSAHNVITIEPGTYPLSASGNASSVLKVPGDSEVVINGTVFLQPNDLQIYRMFDLRGNDIFVHGEGTIVGDKLTHSGTEGEWGMGISVQRSRNVRIEDLTIKDCWGDCIYVGKKSDEVYIQNCTLANGRRQGISVTSAGNVYISDCLIRDVSGTNPQYGIDVEPNRGDTVAFVQIHNVRIVDCKGGITVSCSESKRSKVYAVTVEYCSVSGGVERYAYKFSNTDKVVMKHCSGVKRNIRFKGIGTVVAEKNRITNLEDKKTYQISRCRRVKVK